MIRINAFFSIEASRKAEFLKIARELTEKSLQEAGCVAYDIFESATRTDVMMFCETWKDDAALEAHRQTEHYRALAGTLHQLGEVKAEVLRF